MDGRKEYILPLGGKLDICGIPAEGLKRKGVVIICPGGAYGWLSVRESAPVARIFASYGWTGVVLTYAVGDGPLGTLPVRQLGEAVDFVKEKYPGEKIAVCGFSAGGHLALSLGVHCRTLGLSRPDALILGYPVVTAGEYAHRDSIIRLCGDGDPAFWSLEEQVSSDVPPTFIWATAADNAVPVQNSLLLAKALADKSVPFELVIYPYGVHGLSLATPDVDEPEKGRYADAHVSQWARRCMEWLDYAVI